MLKKIVIGFFLVFVFLDVALLGFFYHIYKRSYVESQPIDALSQTANVNILTPTPTPDPLSPKNILLLGYGGQEHSGGYLTDTIILARVYPREKNVVLISLPRDIWIPLPVSRDGYEYFKINSAYAIGYDDKKYPQKVELYKGDEGAANLAKYGVSYVVGMPVDYFISIDFNGFKKVVDDLGGIEVNVPFSFEDKYYPLKGKEDDPCEKSDEEIKALTATMSGYLLEQQFECRYETIKFEKGRQLMDGETALKFVRSRHSDVNGSDFGRALRQQAFLIAAKERILSMGSVVKIIPLINEYASYVKTDVNIRQAISLISTYNQIPDAKIKTISLTTNNVLQESQSADRQYVLLAKDNDWEKVHEFIRQNLSEFE